MFEKVNATSPFVVFLTLTVPVPSILKMLSKVASLFSLKSVPCVACFAADLRVPSDQSITCSLPVIACAP